jgi:hypothetical protein
VDVVALVPGAVGLALSPLTVASVVFLLGHRRGYGAAVACATGWITTIAVALVVAVLVGERLPARTGAGGTPVEALVALGAGVVLLALAAMRGWIARWGSVFLVVVLVLLAVLQLVTGAVGLLA